MRNGLAVHTFLLKRDVPHEMAHLPYPLRSVESAPELLELPTQQVVIATPFRGAKTVVLALAPCGSAVDVRALERAAGCRVKPVPADEIPELTGYPTGFMPPVALTCDTKVVLDRSFEAQPVLYAGSGEAGLLLKIRPADLAAVAGAVLADIARVIADAPSADAR
ncbi:MAG: YbaK/EbsC family protein [Actinomycetota bacterium]